MNYRIIVLDLDGILTNRDKIITPRVKRALMEAREVEGIVVLAPGRPTPGMEPLAKELEMDRFGGYILPYSGGMIVDCKARETIFTSLFPLESNQEIIELAGEHWADILTYQGGDVITNNKEYPYAVVESNINHLPLRQVEDMKSYVDFQVPKFLMLDDGDYLVTVKPRVEAAMGHDFNVYRPEEHFLEVMLKGIDKAQPLERLLHTLELEHEQMTACGDGYNDLTMIKYTGLGIVTEDVVLPVRNAADCITASNNRDGVGLAAKKLMLGCV